MYARNMKQFELFRADHRDYDAEEWKLAMKKEVQRIIDIEKIWILTDVPPGQKCIGINRYSRKREMEITSFSGTRLDYVPRAIRR
jgi:hypothetical protein